MSRRSLLILTTTFALAAPGAASARPADSVLPPATAAAAAPALIETEATPAGDSSGTGTLTVLIVAGGTLLLGAAAGFEGARLSGRREVVGS
jgi:hypothetical protein